ncbi:hypothetical protein HRW18_02335 [Streptomyces lunaelactis]|uniref:hypothetical protein n=1 Tax=Streptomyces lunaelactis TaxID=1535768 RepID=UPI001585B10F|nr:hypothetical protein [Streptomyces lunaelactis]NUK06870.1 hypothetical protein [Streptomyces lunaelactis]NUL21176.1 hypothetical protein [Streptomyces lunaelactis]NUL28310.1 hypothetical protein [Streptomyces lunaelactis]
MLHPQLAQQSLNAADGPDAPPDDTASRRALHVGSAPGEAAAGGCDNAVEAAATEATIRAMAVELRVFGPSFDEDDPDARARGAVGNLTDHQARFLP